MRWVTYEATDGGPRAGLVIDDQIHALEAGVTIRDLLGDDGENMAAAAETARQKPAEVVAFADAKLHAPLVPHQVRDFLTFLDHLRNARGGTDTKIEPIWYEMPAFYFSNLEAVIGPNDPVEISPGSHWFDFELEVAAVIGKEGSNLHPDEAEAHIAGYTIFCDWSARDLQYREMEFGLGPTKGKDGRTTLGPMLVTPDELEPYREDGVLAMRMQAWINDQQMTDGRLNQMNWTWGEMLAYASRGTTLRPGDVIGSGTVPMGCLIEHYSTNKDNFRGWLRPGDVVRLAVEGLGSTQQEIIAGPEVHQLR